ncbi:arylamine N-acetyltransferase [Halovivax ruber XH-70]|uniref:Arylamine N-acetyltransferase n=1 Tax=Halovivax ruber (strain DSM 18193 / JCM 13892 / XH-70) TaxID=797302 RepID=L0I7N7_HALRX|nr:arylamine N-acetyltransferase [Halovivax ruber]AGB15600.1 arylamine N-acetyltransferase [Halovivax ruber XH-70]
MTIGRYVERLGVSEATLSANGTDALAELQRRHLLEVSFTNAFIDAGAGTSLDPATAVPRTVSGGGGLCYDCNGAFAWLLQELEYDVSLLSARPRYDDGSHGPEYDHLALLVDEHLVDVGFGDFARQPLPLDGRLRSDVSGTYRVIEVADHGGTSGGNHAQADDEPDGDGDAPSDECTHVAQRRSDDGWETLYRFDVTPRAGDEFADLVRFHATSSESPFAGARMATLATADGRLTLSGTSMTVTEAGEKRKESVSASRTDAVLADRFGLDL